jgi:hypothetical protein
LFAGKLLFEPILSYSGDTNFVEHPVIGVSKVSGEQHHRGEEEGNKNEAKTQTHKPSRNHKETTGPLPGRQLQLHINLNVILTGKNIVVEFDYFLIAISVAKPVGGDSPQAVAFLHDINVSLLWW